MFCKNCGAEINDGIAFCANCGTQVENVNLPEEQAQKKNNKTIGLVACLAVVVVLVVALVGIFGGGSYKKAALKYATAITDFEYEKAEKYSLLKTSKIFEEALEKYAKLSGEDVDDLYAELEEEYDVKVKGIEDIYKCIRTEQLENREDAYGKYDVSIEIEDTKELSERKIKNAIKSLESLSMGMIDIDDYIDADKIKKAYEVEISIEIDGEDSDYEVTETYTVVKYKGKWKVLSLEGFNALNNF